MDYKELLATWPQDASGQPEKAVLLKTEADFPAFGGLCLSMLDSFGIPYLTDRPGVGEVANIQGAPCSSSSGSRSKTSLQINVTESSRWFSFAFSCAQ